MTTRYRLAFFSLSALLVTALGRWQTGSFAFLTRDFWYASGLLLLILLSLIDQPHFSKDANVFLNGVTGLIALITVQPFARDGMWNLFFGWSFYLVVSGYLMMLVRTRPLRHEARSVRFVSRLNRTIGRPDALFSAFFVWGLLAQFGRNSDEFRVLLLFWGAFIVLSIPTIASALSDLMTPSKSTAGEAIGVVSRVVSPRIAEIQLHHDAPAKLVGCASIIQCGRELCAYATIIDDRIMAHMRVARVAVTEITDAWRMFARADGEPAEVHLLKTPQLPSEMPISFVDRGSDIGTLKFYINPDVSLQEGEILWVALTPETRAYYQVVSAEITQERSEAPHSIQEVRVGAGQLGTWNSTSSRFEPAQWVAPAGELIFKVVGTREVEAVVPDGHVQVGHVPNSAFPIHVGLDDTVTHNTAIVGVTGSGKSYLAFTLIESLISKGVKVLVLDVTRQHWAFLEHLGPSALRTKADLSTWLDGDGCLAVHQFADATSYPARTAEFVEVVFKHYEAKTKLRPGENEPARLCVVLEEAHSLIPEWNQVAADDDKRQVNKTARVILQGRKYGLGCIVVTQRTANVTKTILNQCNTIFAMQSFDQTGLDFLRNYMGEAYAHAISNLPTRHAILVGKASSSARPVLFCVSDLAKRWPVKTGGVSAPATAYAARPDATTDAMQA